MYEVKRQHHAQRSIEIDAINNEYARKDGNYQEDCAYLNRLKKRHPRDYSVSDIQRLNRIAETGLDVRFNLDKAISQVKEERAKSVEIGTNLDGFRIGYIHKRMLELLDYIKGGN